MAEETRRRVNRLTTALATIIATFTLVVGLTTRPANASSGGCCGILDCHGLGDLCNGPDDCVGWDDCCYVTCY